MTEQLSLVADNAVVLVPDDVWGSRGASTDEFLDWISSIPVDAGLAIDTETAGLGWNDAVRLVQFADSGRGYAVDVSTDSGIWLINNALHEYDGPLVFHNAGFDIHAMSRLGFYADQLWAKAVDTYILAHVQDPSRLNGLDPLVASILGDDDSGYKKQFRASMRKNKWTWATVPVWALTSYGVNDAIKTHRLYSYFCDSLSEQEWDVVEREMAVARAAWGVERHGMRLDREYAEELQETWSTWLASEKYWFSLMDVPTVPKEEYTTDTYGHVYPVENPNANAELIAALQAQGWKPQEFTPTGKAKLDKKVLESLRGEYELVDRLLEYKRINKWLAAYVDNCLEQVDEEGYVHASYNTLGAKTGRMSCSNPPLQQLPKGGGGEIRRLFVASHGCVIASVDYSAIEFRLAGALSGDRRIIDVYLGGGDWYQQVADDLNITRFAAKTFVLAVLYGAGGKRISEALGISFPKAKTLVKNFWNAYPDLSDWVKSQTAQAEAGLPIYSIWGRQLRPHAPYAAANAKIQGTAAEVLKEGLLRLEQRDLLKYVCAIVHDEVVLDVPDDDVRTCEIVDDVVHILRDDRFAVPLVAEGSILGTSWGHGYGAES